MLNPIAFVNYVDVVIFIVIVTAWELWICHIYCYRYRLTLNINGNGKCDSFIIISKRDQKLVKLCLWLWYVTIDVSMEFNYDCTNFHYGYGKSDLGG